MKDKRVTIKELSKIMNVSPTTITNALTGKPKVSEKKRAEIIEKARELGYRPNISARTLVKNGINIAVVISEEPAEFLYYLRKGLEAGVAAYANYKLNCRFITFHDNTAVEQIADILKEISRMDIDGLIFGPGFGYSGYYDIMRFLIHEKKLPVVFFNQVMGDLTGIACIKSNAKVIGQIAAQMLEMCLPEKSEVAVITTSREFALHREALKGFSDEIEQHGNLVVKGVYENQDSKALSYALTEKIISDFPDIKGIYVTSYNSVAVCRCIEKYGKKGAITVIGQDLYPELAAYIENGGLQATIHQNPIVQGEMAVRILFDYITGDKETAGDVFVAPRLVLRSNMECFTDEYQDDK